MCRKKIFSIHHGWQNEHGSLLLGVLVFAAIAITVTTGFVGYAVTLHKVARTLEPKEQALQIAEAGIDYYRWHLAKDPDDYKDGTGVPGPYVHTFNDKNDSAIGSYSLNIIPPVAGSNQITIESTGVLTAYPNVERTIRVVVEQPSFTSYVLLSNSPIYMGPQYEVYGAVHSNGGIRFDGLAHNIVTSSVTSYDDASHADTTLEHGVHTHVKPLPETGVYATSVVAEAPPSGVATRADVFSAGRSFPINAIDFNGLTTQISSLKTQAQSASGRYISNSGALGIHIVLKTNDTMDVYRVNRLTSMAQCNDVLNQATTYSPFYSWSIKSGNGQALIGNYALPVNGVIFVDDNVWVDGQINTAKVTIVAATLPEDATKYRNIIINADLLYTNFGGQDSIGLIAQGNIMPGLQSDTDLVIHAALMSQYAHVWRNYYDGSKCSPYNVRTSLSIYGSITSYLESKFVYPENGNNGYQDITLTYDGYLTTGGSPYYPTSSEDFQILSWEEI